MPRSVADIKLVNLRPDNTRVCDHAGELELHVFFWCNITFCFVLDVMSPVLQQFHVVSTKTFSKNASGGFLGDMCLAGPRHMTSFMDSTMFDF